MKQQTGARIDAELYKRLRLLAVEQETTAAALLEEAIIDLLRKYGQRMPRRTGA